MQTKKTKKNTSTRLNELFLFTFSIEEAARCKYKTVLIIFPLNLQTITITLNVVKWRGIKGYKWVNGACLPPRWFKHRVTWAVIQ